MKQIKYIRHMNQKLLSMFLCIVLCTWALSGCALTGSTEKEEDSGNNHVQKDNAEDSAADDNTMQDQEDSSVFDSVADASESNRKIAISLPDQSSQRWLDDAANMKRGFEAAGCQVITEFADDDAKKQAAQIEEFVKSQADCIVIAPVSSNELADALDQAGEARIPVIAYDSLLMNTDAVSFYLSFDYKGAGILIGQTVIKKAGLDHLADGEYKTIEFFMGDSGNRNARLLYKGLMEALKPYLDEGTLVCKSGRTSMKSAAIAGETKEKAKKRCADILAEYYNHEDLDLCAAALDSLAYGCQEAFKAAGYTVENWPVISGQNCEITACSNILEGTQTFSVYKDTRILAQKCVSMAEAILDGTEPEINDTENYDNHVLIVPAYVCTPMIVDADNLEETLIEGGYYTREQIDSAAK